MLTRENFPVVVKVISTHALIIGMCAASATIALDLWRVATYKETK